MLPESLSTEQILAGINRIKRDGFQPHGVNHTFELIHDGVGYPPLAVLAFALEPLIGKQILPGTLRGEESGREFSLLREAGFTIATLAMDGMTQDELAKQAKKIQVLPENPGNSTPVKQTRTVVEYDRDANVVQAVLSRANGVCEACQRPAEFNRTNGEPYLEVHHVLFLSDGGPDRVWNAVGLCSNCHARCHYGQDAKAYNQLLYTKVPELRHPDIVTSAPSSR